jgi:hypothetical protein
MAQHNQAENLPVHSPQIYLSSKGIKVFSFICLLISTNFNYFTLQLVSVLRIRIILMRIRILLVSLIRMRIRILLVTFMLIRIRDSTIYFDEDPDPDPCFQIKGSKP